MRQELVLMVEEACNQLDERFNQDGTNEHEKIDSLLLGQHDGSSVAEQLEKSPWAADLSGADLPAQLQVLFGRERPASLQGTVDVVSSCQKLRGGCSPMPSNSSNSY